jgi:DNA-binding LytR/AlgR family response regulator
MNSINNKSKSAIIIESEQSIINFLEQTILLIGFEDIRIESNFDFELTSDVCYSIFTNINQIDKVSDWTNNNQIKPQVILYQTEDQKVTNFWNNGFLKTNHLKIHPSAIYVRTRGKLEKICKCDILYIESDKKYCTIVTTNKKYVIRTALKNIHNQLNDDNFVRVHRSYLINQQHIQYVDTQNLNIEIGTDKISIGRRYQEELYKKLMILH